MKLNNVQDIMDTITKYSFYKDEFDKLKWTDVYMNDFGTWAIIFNNDDGQGNFYYYVMSGVNYNIFDEERFTEYYGKNKAKELFNRFIAEN